MVNDTTRLLGLDGLVVVTVEDGTDGQGPVVHLATGDEQAKRCPQCATGASRVKQWVTTTPRDLPVAGRDTRLRWRKRRWYCDNTDCDRGTFTESTDQVPARSRLTGRLRAAAGAAVADAGRTVVQAARDHQVSWPVVSAAFTAHAQAVLPDQPAPVTALGIDEVRRGRPRWVLDEVTRHLADTGRPVAHRLRGSLRRAGAARAGGRTHQRRRARLAAPAPAWREQVRFVAIDMCPAFAKAARQALPNATLVVDHFYADLPVMPRWPRWCWSSLVPVAWRSA